MDARHPRPREKLRSRGTGSLSTFELAQLVIGSGNSQVGVKSIARRLSRLIHAHGIRLSYSQVAAVRGIGAAKASQIVAMCELAFRYYVPASSQALISHADIRAYLEEFTHHLRRGVAIIALDAARRVLQQRNFVSPFDDEEASKRDIVAFVLATRPVVVVACAVVPYDTLHPSHNEARMLRLCADSFESIGVVVAGRYVRTAKGVYEDSL